jgi:hypothetical protein
MPLSASITTRLQYQHESLQTLISGLREEELRQRNASGKWSVFENMAHLAAYQPVFDSRIVRMEKEREPAFGRYVAEEDPLFPSYLEKSPEELIRIIASDRATITVRLTELEETALRRTGLHPKFGLLTVEQWTEFFLLHEAHHLFTVFRLAQELRSPGQ